MCKVIMLTNSKKIKKDEFKKLVFESSKLLGKYERDGFGVSAMTKTGLFCQRYVKPKDVKPDLSLSFKTFAYPSSNQDGELSDLHGAILLHGRTSTNNKTLLNTHPINKHGWSLIHNGVVEDINKDYETITTNDTEYCLERLVQGIEAVEANISGYYVLGAIDDKKQLHVVRDSVANLYTTFIKSLDSFIFATTETLIEDLCKVMGWKFDTIDEVLKDIHLVFDQNGKLIHNAKIKPLGYDYKTASKASLSLGYDLDSPTMYKYDERDCVESEDAFLDEVYSSCDDSYTIIDKKSGKVIRSDEFLELHDSLKIEQYTVIRPDGTICCPVDYTTDKFYEGKL